MDLMEGEVAVPVAGYEKLYAITNMGRVWSFPRDVIGCGNRKKWRQPGFWHTPQKSGFNGSGYLQVGFTVDSDRKMFCVHKLMAAAFLPNPLCLTEINHIDGDKQNNRLENLEWCSHAQNMEHARRNGLYKRQSSTHRGVSWNRHKERWVAFTTVDRKYRYIGQFKTEEEAAAAHRDYMAASESIVA